MTVVRRIEAEGPVELVFRNGFRITVEPPGMDAGTHRQGRPPSPATIKLRAKLLQDRKDGAVLPIGGYVEWFMKQSPTTSRASAYQTVRRELREAKVKAPKAKGKPRGRSVQKA